MKLKNYFVYFERHAGSRTTSTVYINTSTCWAAINPYSSELQNGQVTTDFGGDFTCGSHSESVCNSLSYDLFIVGVLFLGLRTLNTGT